MGNVTVSRVNADGLVITFDDGGNDSATLLLGSGSITDVSNKPTLGTAAAKDVPASGNASATQAVLGADTRLSGLGAADATHDANYTLLPADAGTGLFHSSASAHAWSIDTNANQPIPVGSVIVLTTGQSSGVLTLTPLSGVTFERCDGTAGTGARTMGPASTATARQRATDIWVLSGVFAS